MWHIDGGHLSMMRLPLINLIFCILGLFVFFWLPRAACGVLVPWPGIEPAPPAVEAWSLNHWGTREVPIFCILISCIFPKVLYKYLYKYIYKYLYKYISISIYISILINRNNYIKNNEERWLAMLGSQNLKMSNPSCIINWYIFLQSLDSWPLWAHGPSVCTELEHQSVHTPTQPRQNKVVPRGPIPYLKGFTLIQGYTTGCHCRQTLGWEEPVLSHKQQEVTCTPQSYVFQPCPFIQQKL